MDLREQIERAREHALRRQEEDEAARAQQELTMAKNKRTKWGLVTRPADPSPLEDELDRWADDINNALDAVEAAEKREKSLAATSPVDEQRFSALQGRTAGGGR